MRVEKYYCVYDLDYITIIHTTNRYLQDYSGGGTTEAGLSPLHGRMNKMQLRYPRFTCLCTAAYH